MAPQLKFLKCASSFSSKPKQDAAIEFTQHCYQLHRLVSYLIRSTQLGLVKKNLVWVKKKNTSISLLYGVVDHGNHCLFWRRICLSPSAHRSALPRWRPSICRGRLLQPLLRPGFMWVLKLLLTPEKLGFLAQKRSNLVQNMHFWSYWAKYCQFLHILSNARLKYNA